MKQLLLVMPIVAAGCSGGLEFSNYQPAVSILSPVTEGRVPFCPAIVTDLTAASLDGSFTAPATTTTTSFAENVDGDDSEDFLYTVAGAFEPNNAVSPAFAQLMNQSMTFDVGPSGAVYDDAGAQPAAWNVDSRAGQSVQQIPMTRELVGGGKQSNTRVELVYEYVPSCEVLTIDAEVDVDPADGTPEPLQGSCTCEPVTITYSIGS